MGITIDFASLAVGDYIVSPETAIERKTINDLLASIYDGRLYVQCSDLIQHYSRPVVVIEGNIRDLEDLHNIRDDDQFRIVLDRIQISYDALAKIALDFRIPIIHSPSAEYSSRLLLTMARISMEEGHNIGPFLKKIKKKNPLYLQQLFDHLHCLVLAINWRQGCLRSLTRLNGHLMHRSQNLLAYKALAQCPRS